MKIVISQTNFTVGDLSGNFTKIAEQVEQAEAQEADLIIFSELALNGYPPNDLILNKDFRFQTQQYLKRLSEFTYNKNVHLLIGAIGEENNQVYNSAFFIGQGQILARIDKQHLPNYDNFDEKRYFSRGNSSNILQCNGTNIGCIICEDLWEGHSVIPQLKLHNCKYLVVINASPFDYTKYKKRLAVLQKQYTKCEVPIIYVNQIGGQDSLIYDGNSLIFAENTIKKQLAFCEEDFALVNMANLPNEEIEERPAYEAIYIVVMLGLRDYIYKNNFNKVVLGLSGGIDSAIVATLAADALGANAVTAINMPTEFSDQSHIEDANNLAYRLGVDYLTLPIEELRVAFNNYLNAYNLTKQDITKQNVQARLRGLLLMAYSNDTDSILLSTGNKSELAVGYATIYGDMCGGYNPLKDIYKTQIYELVKWRNNNIPKNSLNPILNPIDVNFITKAPTAELKFNQKDEDSLPPYELLDKLLFLFIERDLSRTEIVKLGYNKGVVEKVYKLVRNSQYKRQQAVIGPKISERSFDLERRYPITNKF